MVTSETLTRALEQTAVTILITNRDGVIEYVNPAFEQVTGYSREFAVGRTPRLLQSGVQTAEFYDKLWATILSGQTFQAVITNRRQDGQLIDQEQTITPIRQADGEITHFVSTGSDVTTRRRGGNERLHQQLEHEAIRVASLLHDEVGQFLALAHLTLADVAHRLPPEMSERLQEARRYLDHVEDRLREVARGVQPRVVADLGFIEAIRFLAKGSERRLGVPVTVTIPEDLRCPASIETLLYRVTQDTLLNVAYQEGVSAVNVVISRVVRGRRQADTTVACTITSDGARWALSTDPSLGPIGLTSVLRQVEAVGGTLTIEAAPGRGTEVRAVLPVAA